MNIDHVAIWTKDLEGMRTFYETFFHARAGNMYINPKTQFRSYFLHFESGARIELMQTPAVRAESASSGEDSARQAGYAHIAISVGSKEKVDALTARLEQAGYRILSGPRTTGDGYYESVVSDPENNLVEITI